MPVPVVFPGQPVTAPPQPVKKPNAVLKLGPGLVAAPPSAVTSHRAGELITDMRRHAIWIEANSRRYIPTAGDSVVAIVQRSSADAYICAIPSSFSPVASSVQATLPHLAFPQATKKTRPILYPGATVYARVSFANKHMDPELECFDAESGKGEGFGELKGGMIFSVSLGMARRLLGDGKKLAKILRDDAGEMATGAEILEELGKQLAFECAVGRNGKVWVDSVDVRTTLCIGRCIAKSEDLNAEEVRKLVRDEIRQLHS